MFKYFAKGILVLFALSISGLGYAAFNKPDTHEVHTTAPHVQTRPAQQFQGHRNETHAVQGHPVQNQRVQNQRVENHRENRHGFQQVVPNYVYPIYSTFTSFIGPDETNTAYPNGTWVDASDGDVPQGAMIVQYVNGTPVYYCQAEDDSGAWLEGQLVAGSGCVINDTVVTTYQVLVQN